MTADTTLSFIFVVLLLAAGFFFAGSETALTAASRARLLALQRGGNRAAQTVNKVLEAREAMIGSLLVGTSIVNTAAASLTTGILLALFGDVGIVYATIAISVMTIIFAELLPKTIAINYPERRDLAAALKRMVEMNWRIDGASDHGTHEALYLSDPDGIGIELAWDRDPSVWTAPDGSIVMKTARLDLQDLLGELERSPQVAATPGV